MLEITRAREIKNASEEQYRIKCETEWELCKNELKAKFTELLGEYESYIDHCIAVACEERKTKCETYKLVARHASDFHKIILGYPTTVTGYITKPLGNYLVELDKKFMSKYEDNGYKLEHVYYDSTDFRTQRTYISW